MAPTVLAHGVKIETKTTQAMEIQAAYDSGEPMTDASITIYAPNDPATPWRQGNTDGNGRFMFAPDLSLPGTWDIKVRKAGHGGIVHVTVDSPEAGVVEERNPTHGTVQAQSLSPLQKGVMLASVVWGCVGTALFFADKGQRTKDKGQRTNAHF
ncbi:MAG TPA: carboxypeptidase regulatory-like domain-containing protein [Oscillatoriaceae cyanobacterium M33_DOE_052]|uniref:Carboxypeptidase regulatory-like domain-containing protein n=1 Tax=Planktothricoides sp. SpSt-374 TaxID=2282167 RepID=A0A7C3ZZQ0_9CYAN|nr:carboxypeptidase regulatory-like domain-containing protein [Oscillatoriaceae cyanobacterium M33_DOE_052]